MTQTCHDPSLALVLQRLSKRLDWLADAVHHIEHAIGDELGPRGGLPSGNIERLQQLDLIRQTLEDLAILSLALAEGRAGHVESGIAQKLRLAATKDMLDAGFAVSKAAPETVKSGAVDLF